MKKFLLTLLAVVLTLGSIYADDFKIRLVENEMGYMEVQMKCVNPGLVPTTATPISGFTFQIEWPTSLGADIELLCSSNNYNLHDGLAALQTTGNNNWRTYYAANTPFNCPTNWVYDQWETITSFIVSTGTGVGNFDIPSNGTYAQGLNWQIQDPIVFYHPDVISGISGYSFPTLVYDYVWVGGNTNPPFYDGNSWTNAANWEDQCSGAISVAPSATNNTFIPGGLANYPTNIYAPSAGFAGNGLAQNVRIAPTGNITIGNISHQDQLTFSGKLMIYGSLTIAPDGWVTVSGDTYIDAAQSLVVEATDAGVGSFINDGAISYGTSGSGKVQTYITNGAVATNFYMHLMGPTLDEENYTGTGTGADLSAFNVAPGNTYAYSFDEPTNSWVNQYSNTYPVYTSAGIGLSTDDATPYTMNMTGEFIYGNVTTAVLTHGGSGYNLISNPYPSAVDFDVFASDNSDIISNKYWMWDAGSGNYITRASGSGSQQYIQVGQAFFVQAVPSGGTVTFDNSYRTHSNDAFRDVVPNMLTMKVSGGDHGFSDRLTIRFDENATSGYDEEIESVKWNSMYADATMIRSIAEDGTELAINVLPLEGLQGDMVSVPVHFNCGYTADYTFDFEGIDSFEADNEVWLEDKNNNDHWFYLNNNPHYTFTAAPGDDPDRFIVHFFGPTSINDNNEAKVDIFSDGQYAYIKNVTNENIKKVSVYNIAGSLVTSRIIPEGQKLSKIWVSDHMAYYVVQVITDSKVYTNKILITK